MRQSDRVWHSAVVVSRRDPGSKTSEDGDGCVRPGGDKSTPSQLPAQVSHRCPVGRTRRWSRVVASRPEDPDSLGEWLRTTGHPVRRKRSEGPFAHHGLRLAFYRRMSTSRIPVDRRWPASAPGARAEGVGCTSADSPTSPAPSCAVANASRTSSAAASTPTTSSTPSCRRPNTFGSIPDHALFLAGDESPPLAGVPVADGSTGCWVVSTSHRWASSAPATARTSSSAMTGHQQQDLHLFRTLDSFIAETGPVATAQAR